MSGITILGRVAMYKRAIERIIKRSKSLGDFDLATGVHESLLNAFSAAHHAAEHPKSINVDKGSGEAAELKLRYAYDIAEPATFDLDSLGGFAKIMSRWLIQQPEILAQRSSKSIRDFLGTPQPNLR